MQRLMTAMAVWAGVILLGPVGALVHADIDPLVPGRAMIRLNNATLPGFMAILKQDHPQIEAFVIDDISSRNMYLIQFTPPPPWQLENLENDLSETYVLAGHLAWGELLYEGQTPEGKTGSTWVDHVGSLASFRSQYASGQIGVPTAQQRSTGAGVLVAVLDTGISPNHPVVQNQIALGGYNFITNSTDTNDVGDGLDNDGDGLIDEQTGHGTYVAGLIALVAPEAQLLPITVLNSDGIGHGWALVKGLYFAIDRGVEVINLSLSSTYDSDAVEEAVQAARSLGIAVAAAAGNFNRNDVPEYPAMLRREDGEFMIFGVTATDYANVKAPFSNYSNVPERNEVFISAPGETTEIGNVPDPDRAIISTLPNGQYGIWEGTSMCTPLVSGTLALIRSQHPEWPSNLATWNATEAVLRTSAFNHYPMNPAYANPPQLGVGRLDTAAAVALGPVAPRRGDLNGDGVINVADLFTVINRWAQVHTSADINNDGTVNVTDLLFVINNWG